MKCPASRSRSGWRATRSTSSPSTALCRPADRSASIRSSIATSRRSSMPWNSRDAPGAAVSPARTGPRHSASASRYSAVRAAGSAVLRAVSTSRRNRCASTPSGSARKVYPGGVLTRSAPRPAAPASALRSRATWANTTRRAVGGGSSQTSSISRSSGRQRPHSMASRARSSWRFAGPRSTGRPSTSASTGPSTRNSTVASSTRQPLSSAAPAARARRRSARMLAVREATGLCQTSTSCGATGTQLVRNRRTDGYRDRRASRSSARLGPVPRAVLGG